MKWTLRPNESASPTSAAETAPAAACFAGALCSILAWLRRSADCSLRLSAAAAVQIPAAIKPIVHALMFTLPL